MTKNLIKNAVSVGFIGAVAHAAIVELAKERIDKKYAEMPCASVERAAILSTMATSELETYATLADIAISTVCFVVGIKMNKRGK